MPLTAFFVEGRPGPKGSRTRTKFGSRPASKFEKPWMDAVQAAAADHPPLKPPYSVALSFRFLKGKSNKYPYPVVADPDKLVRTTLDGMVKGGLLADDVHVTVGCWDVEFGPKQGCWVRAVEGPTMW